MAPTRTRKQVRFRDQYERPRNKVSPNEKKSTDGINILTRKDEICRFITGALSRFLKPIEIPTNTHLIEHRPWSAGGIYTIRSVEPILPNTRYDLAARVIIHHEIGWVQMIFSIARGLFDRVSLPPVQWLEVPNMELPLNNGMKVCVQIEDSIHGQLLASYLKKLDLLELQRNGPADLENPQRDSEGDHAESFERDIEID